MTKLPAKLGVLLRKLAAIPLVLAAKFKAPIAVDEVSREPVVRTGATDLSESTRSGPNGKDHPMAGLTTPEQSESPLALSQRPADREELIRRRWIETGIKMWSPDVHGSGKSALKIQGQAELLPRAAGQTSRGYDKLEFKLVEGRIVCEGVMIDPPKGRRRVEHRTNS
jgi:hypothetical protein